MVHEVKTEVFEGPIDLLLQLITRQRVDIYEVSLAAITEEYLRVLDDLEGFDLEQATGFLVIAATLLELKSARLLPQANRDETDPRLLEERDLLLAKLVELSTFREAGAWLSSQLTAGEGFIGRTAALEPHLLDLVPDPLQGLTGSHLARAAARALAPGPPAEELDTSHVAAVRESVRDAIAELALGLGERGRASFRSLCGHGRTRIEVVVRFLALLELFKAGAIDLQQADRFGDITASWTGEMDVQTIVEGAEEYMLEAGGDR
ncbi:MAG: segregation/condensation protein A [Actinomycetota bacterium]|nr:segregation/condensation protein A [Actinomycetota bacterium]